MASTAALMQAMESFDSSVDATHHHAGAGHMTAGGISLAPSFHSEDYEDEPLARGSRQDQRYTAEEESSLMEEEELFDQGLAGGDSGLSEETPEPRLAPTRKSAGGSRPTSSLSTTTGGTGTHRTQASSRYPSASTAPTDYPPSPKRAFMPSGVAADLARDDSSRHDEQSVSGGQSAVLGGLEVDDSASTTNWQARGESGGSKKGGGGGMGQNMTLREQEKVIDEFKKENFDLKLKIHFYEQRLERLAPDHIEQALRENIQLKVEFQTLRTELKRYKKLLLEGNRAIESLTSERDQALRNGASSTGQSASRRERDMERELARLRQAADRDRENRDTLERRLGDQSRELRDIARKTKSSEYGGEDYRVEIERLRDELDAEREAHEEALADQEDLRYRLQEVTDRLEEAQDDVERLREHTDGRGQDESNAFGDLSRSGRVGEGKSRRQLEIENDDHRDRASAHALEVERLESELARKEQEIEDLLGDIDQRDIDHATAIKQTDDDCTREVEDARAREAQMRDLLEEKENDIDELADKIESLMKEIREKEIAARSDAEEVEALTHDLQKLGAQILALEEEADEKENRIRELESDLDAMDKESEVRQRQHDQAIRTLEDDFSRATSRLRELTAQHESLSAEHGIWRDRAAKLEELGRADADAKRRLQDEAVEIMRALRKEEEEREQAREEATQLKNLVEARECDVRALQDALNGLEASLNRAGQTHSSDRSALELELERLKRDVSRNEHELVSSKRDLEEKTAALREEELRVMTLESEIKDLSQQLASQTQTRLALTDKYDEASKDQREWRSRLQAKQAEVDSGKALITELQGQIATLRSAESSPGTSAKITDLTTRASRAERHLAATQAQLADAELKLGEARQKVAVAEGKWEARVKEFERLVRSLKEENKRLKQGAKERVSELEDFIQSLQEEKKRADHRKAHLDDVLSASERAKTTTSTGVAR